MLMPIFIIDESFNHSCHNISYAGHVRYNYQNTNLICTHILYAMGFKIMEINEHFVMLFSSLFMQNKQILPLINLWKKFTFLKNVMYNRVEMYNCVEVYNQNCKIT